MRHKSICPLLVCVLMFCACGHAAEPSPIEIGIHRKTKPQPVTVEELTSLPETGSNGRIDISNCDISGVSLAGQVNVLPYLRFNTTTVWPENIPGGYDPQKVIELGKDPGFHVRDLHAQGIDGSGVSIGIVDLTLYAEHQEYKDNLVHYEDIPQSDVEWHMHGAGVASLAVGKSTGVAPGAKLYFIEASWDDDKGAEGETTYRYYAQGIHRLLDINQQLSDQEKIRVISISAYPSPDHGVNDYADYARALARAKSEGVFVIAVSSKEDYGFAFGGLGREPLADPNNIHSYYATTVENWKDKGRIFFPMGSRTYAAPSGEVVYGWDRSGGASWTAPYIAGLYALAAQVKPDVTPEIFMGAIRKTADTVFDEGYGKEILIANPVGLISELEAFDGQIWVTEQEPLISEDAAATSEIRITKDKNGVIHESVDYAFVLDEAAVGEWEVVGFVEKIDDFDPAGFQNRSDYFYIGNSVKEDGKVTIQFTTGDQTAKWSKGYMVWEWSEVIPAYEIRHIDNETYMFVQWKSGEYTQRGREPYYYVFMKTPE